MTEETAAIDEIDREILSALVADSRMTTKALGERVGLSANAAGARMQRLVSSGLIDGFTIRLNTEKLGLRLLVDVDCQLTDPYSQAFVEVVASDQRVLRAERVTGGVDYRLRAALASAEELDTLLARLRREGDVIRTDTRVVMTALDLPPRLG